MKKRSKNKTKLSNLPRKIQDVLPLAMLQMARKIREENKRWGLPLITWKDGKIFEIPTNVD